MVPESLALATSVAASGDRPTAIAVLVAIFALQVGIVLTLRRIFRPDDSDGDEPGSDGGGPGRRNDPAPRQPPPDGMIRWPEFERQFADYVAGLRTSVDRRAAGEREHTRPPD
jgi:hypothetical protein